MIFFRRSKHRPIKKPRPAGQLVKAGRTEDDGQSYNLSIFYYIGKLYNFVGRFPEIGVEYDGK